MNEEGFRIEFKIRDPRHRRLTYSIAFGLITFITAVFAMLIGTLSFDATWHWLYTAGIVVVGLVCVVVLITLFVTALVNARIEWDGTALLFSQFNQTDKQRNAAMRFPLDEIQGLRLYCSGKKTTKLSLSAPLGKMLWRGQVTHVEVVTEGGVIVALKDWDEADQRWALAVIAQKTGVAILPDRRPAGQYDVAAEPKAMTTGHELSPEDNRSLTLMLLGAFAVLFGIGSCSVLRTAQVQGWPETTAKLTELDVTRRDDRSRLHLTYDYTVDGTGYTAHEFDAGDVGWPAREAFVEQHEVGDTVPAFFNPDDPSEAVLYREYDILAIVLFFALALLSLYGAIHFLLKTHRPEAVDLQEHFAMNSEDS